MRSPCGLGQHLAFAEADAALKAKDAETLAKIRSFRQETDQLKLLYEKRVAKLQKDLAEKGMAFNQAKSDTFRDKLRRNGFYSEWKGKYGDEAWALLERYSGKLA